MSNKDLGSVCGSASGVLKCLCDLANQIKAQGGKKEDLDLLFNHERVFKRVAFVLAQTGRLKRPFKVSVFNRLSNETRTEEIFLQHLYPIQFGLIGMALNQIDMRLADEDEMRNLIAQNQDILSGNEDLRIVGKRIEEGLGTDESRNVVFTCQQGISFHWISDIKPPPDNTLFATIFTVPNLINPG